MKTAFSALLLVLTAAAGYAQSYEPVKVNGKYGFAEDLSGGPLVIPANYEYATHFREERALVKQQGRWGFIDPSGNWITEPKFDRAQPFTDGRARVYLNGKAGMVALDGSYIVEPIYDGFDELWFGMVVYNGELQGLISDNNRIPVEYLEIWPANNGFVSALRADRNGYDLYYDGKRILEKMDEVSGTDYWMYDNMRTAVVSVNGKTGLADTSGNWIIEPNYNDIRPLYLNVVYNEDGEAVYTYVYRLDATEYQFFDDAHESFEVVGSYRFYLAAPDGKLISEQPFEAVASLDDSSPLGKVQVTQNGKIGLVREDLSIWMSPYNAIRDYYSFKIAEDGERVHILDQGFNEIGVFDEVQASNTEITIYDEYGEPVPYYMTDEYLPYAIVTNGSQSSIFDMEEKKLVSPWSTGQKDVALSSPNGYDRLYQVYDNELQRYSFYHDAMDASTGFDFEETAFITGGYIAARKSGEDRLTLMAIDRLKGASELMKAPSMVWSESVYIQETPDVAYAYDEEDYGYSPAFHSPFVLYSNLAGRYGIVAQDRTIVPAIFDTLIQSPELNYILNGQAGGKWGSIDVRNGRVVQPEFDDPLAFRNDPELMTDYVLFEERGYYVSTSGQQFRSLGSTYMRFKEKGLVGLRGYNDFSFIEGSEETVVVIPPVYKEILFTDYPHQIIAKGQNNKYGLINQFNDTLLPFVHTAIETDWDERLIMDMPLLELQNGKKKGVYGIYNGKSIPAQYDRLVQMNDFHAVPIGVVVIADGKTGLFNPVFEPVLSCSYDGLLSNFVNESTELYALKNGKWYMLPDVNPYALTEKKLLARRSYDLIIEGYGYVRTANGYDRYETTSGALLASNVPEDAIHDKHYEFLYELFVKDGRIGAKDENGKVVLKPSLTCVMSTDSNTLYSFLDGEPTYFDLSKNKQYTATEW